MKVFGVVLIMVLFYLIHLQAKTYYVDPVSGSDADAGTLDEPWQSVTKPLNLPVPEGRTKAAAEEITVILQGGEYGALNLSDADGAAKAAGRGWITYQAAVGETPVFSGMQFNFSTLTPLYLRFIGLKVTVPKPAGRAKAAAAAGSPINLKSVSNAEYKNTSFLGSGYQSHTPCVRLSSCSNLTFDHCEVAHYGSGYTINGCSGLEIRYNHIHDFSGSGIKYMTNNKNGLLEYNHIHDQQTWDASHASAISIRSGDLTVRGNIMHDGWTSSCMMFYNDDMGNTYVYNNLTIENNVMYDVTNGYYIFRINKLGTNVTIRNNTIFEPLKDAFIVHSLAPGYNGSGLKVYNNLIAGATVGIPATATVKNNIFSKYNNSYTTAPATNMMSGSPTVFMDGYFTDTPLITKNHGQTLDFSLASTSPAIGFGDPALQSAVGLGSLGADGFIRPDGVKRDATHHSAGAYESTETTNIDHQIPNPKSQIPNRVKKKFFSLRGCEINAAARHTTGIYLVQNENGRLAKTIIFK